MAITTTTTWQTLPNNELFESERKEWLTQAVSAGKTASVDVSFDEDTPLIKQRTWTNEDAANEWKTFIEALATKYGTSASVTW